MHEMTLYQKILETNLVNFIIMVCTLVFIFKKAKLGSIFDKMADDIKTSVMTSSEAAQAALREYKEAKRSTKNLDAIKKEIEDNAKNTAERTKEAFCEMLLKEKNVLESQFEARIESDTLKVKEDITKDFLNIVSKLTEDEIQKRLTGENGAEIQSRLIDNCINDIDAVDFSKGGI